MTVNVSTARRVRNMLVGGLLCTTAFSAVAFADTVTIGGAGYWTASQGTNNQENSVCVLGTQFPATGGLLGVIVRGGDPRIHFAVSKATWHIQNGASVGMKFRFDNGQVWDATATSANNSETSIDTGIDLGSSAAFVHEFTSSSVLHITFTGNEPEWTASLQGTTAAWGSFMSCVRMIDPQFVAALTPTQPVAPVGPAQPAARVLPTQPFTRL